MLFIDLVIILFIIIRQPSCTSLNIFKDHNILRYWLLFDLMVILFVIMNINAMTDQAIAANIGRRIEQIRLQRNLTQQALADAVGLSRVSYRNLVAGRGKFTNVIAVLRALGQLDLVEQFVPEAAFSPMQQLKMKGKQRRRASGPRGETAGENEQSSDDSLDW